ncbi:MAG: hypothetical protein APF80_17255 [Alphaproteobacteria bacterium BRH_c36]|nr:MAG: hypothetical protein APF80_17255 [Alphaproteobacteria bacterium BRH_c36]
MRKALIAIMTAVAFLGPGHGAFAQEAPLVSGEVTKLNPDAGKMTIKHDPIPNLDMGSMTMVFKAKDAEMLKSVKPGDKVRFTAERVNGQLTVTKIEPKK